MLLLFLLYINKLNSVGVACASLRVCGHDIEERIQFANDELKTGKFKLIFTHSEEAVGDRDHFCPATIRKMYGQWSYMKHIASLSDVSFLFVCTFAI